MVMPECGMPGQSMRWPARRSVLGISSKVQLRGKKVAVGGVWCWTIDSFQRLPRLSRRSSSPRSNQNGCLGELAPALDCGAAAAVQAWRAEATSGWAA
jgi:hypothetical protein